MRVFAILILNFVPTLAEATAFPSVSCDFTEPFLTIDVWNGGMRVITPEGAITVADRTLSGSNLAPIVHANINGKAATLAITHVQAGDGMSDFQSPFKGVLTGWPLATPQYGACLRYRDGAVPRPVAGVMQNSRLNVRTQPRVSSRIIGSVNSSGRFWAYPEPVFRGWVRGGFEVIPKGESGMITVSEGWVNARYLGPPLSQLR